MRQTNGKAFWIADKPKPHTKCLLWAA